jgi:hypothetical protein
MKTKLLKKLRKRFNWKFVNDDGIKKMFIYDKEFNVIKNNGGLLYLFPNDLGFLLDQYNDTDLISKYRIKKIKIKFENL